MTDKARSKSLITEGLRDWGSNQRENSADALLKLVYAELHRQAQRHLQKERAAHTFQTTALVHEVYFKLAREGAASATSRPAHSSTRKLT